jgi:hypothetical protein
MGKKQSKSSKENLSNDQPDKTQPGHNEDIRKRVRE